MTTTNRHLRFPTGPAFRFAVLAFGAAFAVAGQTTINLATQVHNVDFTNAPYTRPVKTGTALPVTCSTGDFFFNITTPAGQNLYGCIATNVWALQSSPSGLSDPGSNGLVLRTAPNTTSTVTAPAGAVVGTTDTQSLTNKSIDGSEITSGTLSALLMPAFSGDVSTSAGSTNATLATVNSSPGTFGDSTHSAQLTVDGKGRITNVSTVAISAGGGGGTGAAVATQLLDFAPTISGTSVTFGSSCSASTPCLVYLNGARYVFTNSSSLAVSGSASDMIFFYVDGAGTRTIGYGSANTYTPTNLVAVGSITSFPQNIYPLYQCTVTSGSFTACSDYRPILAKTTFSNGQGTAISQSGGVMSINLAEAVDYTSTLNYVVPGTACGHFEIGTNASDGTWGLPQPGVGGMMPNGCVIAIKASAAGSITLTPTASTINGAANYVVASGQVCRVVSDGANYLTEVCQ